jgi:hypothetical protein
MELLQALAASPPAALLRDSALVYPLVNAAHILGFALLVGAIATLDLRLLGAFRAVPAAQLAAPLARVAACGLALAAVAGFALFSTRPLAYLENPAFLLKLGLVGLGLANAVALRASGAWREVLGGAAPGGLVRAGAVVSLLAWTGAVFAGRWIGFLQ